MPKIIVQTDDGREVYRLENLSRVDLGYPNARAEAIRSTLARAIEDAQAIQAGVDPERPSERAMRESDMEEVGSNGSA